jgi:ATP-binding cassette subfamily B protein RaxB
MLLAFFAYKEQFSLRVAALIDKAVDLAMLSLQGERLADITTSAVEAMGSGTTGMALASPPTIELRDLHFRYGDGEPEVLAGVNLRIAPGESLAITGPSGGGKSTLLKLLLGLETPTRGEVLVNGRPLAQLGLEAWRDAVGTVMQEDPLLIGSIAANIAFFAPDAQPAQVERCARLAGIHDDIVAMPMGYETLVGDMGSALSGGQRQRILLARALFKQPQLLVLDEATSALDLAGERRVNEAVQALALTRIVVAHRPETIAAMGRVVRLQGGRVVSDSAAAASGQPADPGP